MGSSWRQNIVEIGCIGGWDDHYLAPKGTMGLAALILTGFPGYWVTNFGDPTVPSAVLVHVPGMAAALSITVASKPDPLANFPYGFDVDPDVPA